MFKKIVLTGLVLAGTRSAAWCARANLLFSGGNGEELAASAAPALPSGWELLMKTAGSMILVVILIFVVVFVLRRYVLSRNGLGNGAQTIHILSSSYIGPKKSIHLVKILNRVLVLGVSESHIQTLSEFGAEEVDRLLPQSIPHSGESQSFSKIIRSIVKRAKDEPNI